MEGQNRHKSMEGQNRKKHEQLHFNDYDLCVYCLLFYIGFLLVSDGFLLLLNCFLMGFSVFLMFFDNILMSPSAFPLTFHWLSGGFQWLSVVCIDWPSVLFCNLLKDFWGVLVRFY